MHTCRARRACHPDEPISKCLLRKRRVLYTEPRLSSFDAGPEPVLHLIGGQPTFQPSRASGPSPAHPRLRSEEHTSELQSLMRISYAVFCLTKKTQSNSIHSSTNTTQKKTT